MKKNSFFYKIYNLILESDISLEGLNSYDNYTSINSQDKIKVSHIFNDKPTNKKKLIVKNIKNGVKIFYGNSGIYKINFSKKNIHSIFKENNILQATFPGLPLIPFIFHKGGIVLHASCVSKSSKGATIFLGEKGMGKSTLALFISQLYDWNILGDDGIALYLENESLKFYSGVKRMRLWPNSLKYFNINIEKLPKVISFQEKRYYNLRTFNNNDSYISKIYWLKRSNTAEISFSKMENKPASFLLKRNIKGIKHFKSLFYNKSEWLCDYIVKRIPVYKLIIPNSLAELESQIPYLMEHIQR